MMADWMVWLAAAGVLIVLELFTGTFYLLMMAIGLAFGALAAWLGAAMPVQTIVAAVVGIAGTGLLHRRTSTWTSANA
jgi:membrane protein implicated in regulation of membrane protease activity